VLTAGQGARFPATPFYLSWYNFTDYPYAVVPGGSLQYTVDPNRETVLVTANVSDTLTVTRSATPSTHNIGGKTYKMRILGPQWSKFHQFQPAYKEVTDKHIYEDGGASFLTFDDTAPIRWTIIYEDFLLLAEVAVLDAHRAEAFGEVYGFSLYNARDGVTYTGVHYDEEFSEDHSHMYTNSNSREIHLIKRPV
jgi:hypothetical protein